LTKADIVRDFQSKVLQEEWNKFGGKVMERRNERIAQMQQAAAELQQKHNWNVTQRQQRVKSTEAAIEKYRAEFADLSIALEHDANSLLNKFGSIPASLDDINKDSKPLPCLGQRAHWMDCQKKYAADSRPCNFYVQALEECVQKTIGRTTLQQEAA
jgi:hypothetical protein